MKNWTKPRTIFALMFYTAFLTLIMLGRDVPDGLNHIVSILFGFYFGSKVVKKEDK